MSHVQEDHDEAFLPFVGIIIAELTSATVVPIRDERRHSTCTPGRSGAVSHRPGHHVCPHPVTREPSSSWTANTSLQEAFQEEVASSGLGGTWRKGGNPLGSNREGKRALQSHLLAQQ